MIRHVTLINFKDDTSEAQKRSVLAAFETLPNHIPEVKDFSVGLDLCLLEGNADLMVLASFDSEVDFLTYSTHQAHTDVIFPVCGPVMADYSTAQISA